MSTESSVTAKCLVQTDVTFEDLFEEAKKYRELVCNSDDIVIPCIKDILTGETVDSSLIETFKDEELENFLKLLKTCKELKEKKENRKSIAGPILF